MAALPYMPLFVADYLADTAHLTAQQHGAYMLLIMNYWQRGAPLPDDDSRLAKIARVGPREWARMRDTISEFFSIADGQWLHSRIASELARVEAKSLKSKKAAQASVQRRFGGRSTDVEPTEAQAHTNKIEPKGSPKGLVEWEKQEALASCLRKAFPPPEGVSPEQWAAFNSQRKKKLSDHAYSLLCKKLAKLSEEGWPPNEMIDRAIEHGWETVFPPRQTNERPRGPPVWDGMP